MAKKEAYYEKILDWFKDQLITGALKEGDIVPSERDLAAQFGVSRVPVREALHILEFSGTISKTSDGMKIQVVNKQWVQPQVSFSPQMTQQSLEYLFEVRIFLESSAAQYAARRRTDEDIAQMRATIQKMLTAMNDPEQAGSDEIIRASHQFHRSMIRAAKNPILEELYGNLFDLLQYSKQNTLIVHHDLRSTVMDHEAILSRIESGNAAEAGQYVRFHLERALERLHKKPQPHDQ